MATLKMCEKIVKLLRFFINEKLYTFGGIVNFKIKKISIMENLMSQTVQTK
jgi:hypothetical protein